MKHRAAALVALAFLNACASTPTLRFEASTDAGGCLLERIAVDDGVAQFSFNGLSPDGRTLAIGWERGEGAATERGAYLLDLRTGVRENLPAFNNAVSFSRDGDTLIGAVFTTAGLRTEIVAQDRRNGETRTYASDPSAEFLPSFSADQQRIYFNSYRTGGSDLYAFDVSTGATTPLTSSDQYEAYARLSPDGRQLAFHRNLGDGNYDVFVLDLQTGQERAVAQDPGEDSYPAWSPDGRWILFSSDRARGGGRNDLYIVSAAGGQVTLLTEAGGNDSYANWALNGRDVYFVSHRDNHHGVYRLRLDRNLQCQRTR